MNAGRFLALAPLQIAQALVGFGAIAAFTRLMSADEFGRYALALSVSMAAHTVLFTWAEAAAFRFLAAARAERRVADHFATLAAIAAALGVAVLAITLLVLSLAGLRDELTSLAAFAAAAAVLRFITRIGRESDRAALAFARYAVLETAYLTIGFAAGVACLLVFDFGPAAPFAGLVLAGLLVALIDAPRLFAQAEGGAPSLARARQYGAYGAPLALALAVDLGVQAVARIILAESAGPAELGAYAAAFGLARPLDLMFMGVSAAFAPLVFAAYEEKGPAAARSIAGDAFLVLAAVTAPAAVGLALVAGPVSALMVGEALRAETARALPWLAFAGLCSGFTLYYWSEAFQLTRRTGLRALLMLAPGAVQLGLTAALAPWGAMGAGAAAAAGAVTGMALLALVGRGLFALPLRLAGLARIALAALAMACAVIALAGAGLALQVAAGAAAYLSVLAMLDLFGARAHASALLQALVRKLRGARQLQSGSAS
ncbi:MAG: lipopolysaccharide biosynthesis protein [Hyphomonadaceae bacterium]